MKRIIFSLLFTVLITPLNAYARPGFFIGFGTGTSDSEGDDVSYFDLNGSPFLSDGSLYTTEMNGGTLGSFKLGFNILGYAALETMAQYLHPSTPNDTEAWMANFHVGGRLYPMWHWRGELPSYLQPLEPSISIRVLCHVSSVPKLSLHFFPLFLHFFPFQVIQQKLYHLTVLWHVL